MSLARFLSSETGLVGLVAVASGGLAVFFSSTLLAVVSAAGLLAVVWRTATVSVTRTEKLRGQINGLVHQVAELTRRIDDVDRRIDGVDGRIDGVDGQLDGLNRRADGFVSRIDTSDEVVAKLERGAVKRLRALETGVRLATESLEAQQDQVNAGRAEADRRAVELEESSARIAKQAAVVEERTSMLAIAASSSTPPRELTGVLMLMTIHRSGSTRLLDMLRTHPAVRLAPDMEVWNRLGLRGRRYPVAFSNTADARVAIEIQQGEGAVIEQPEVFATDAPTDESWWAVEKAHPQFADFDSLGFVTSARQMIDQGIRLRMVYGIRRPLEAMWSMVEFQQRQPSWQAWLPVEDFPDWIRRSLWSIVEMQEELPGDVIDFVDLDGGEPLRLLGRALGDEWDETTSAEWLHHATVVTDKSRRKQSAGTGFIGQRDPDRSELGPNGCWEDRLEIIADAERAYELISNRELESLSSPKGTSGK